MKKKAVMMAVVLLFVTLVSIASALQINVDGNPSDWVPAASVATSPSKSIPLAGWDIKEVFFTNDQNNFYWRIDTYAQPQWNLPSNQVIMQICMNTDNNITTGVNLVGSCNNAPVGNFGFDYIILLNSNGSANPTIRTYVCPDCNTPGSTAQVASSGTTTEIRVPISDLNLSNCNSGADCVIPTTVYSTQFPVLVDWVPAPDQTFNVTLPGPTAVSLNTITAMPTTFNATVWAFIAVGLLSGIGLVLLLKNKTYSNNQ